MAAIDIAGVTKTFGSHVAVDDLSLSVDEGTIYGFIGPNGSGKTTTLRMIMNILLPDRGRIQVLGRSGSGAAHDDATANSASSVTRARRSPSANAPPMPDVPVAPTVCAATRAPTRGRKGHLGGEHGDESVGARRGGALRLLRHRIGPGRDDPGDAAGLGCVSTRHVP